MATIVIGKANKFFTHWRRYDNSDGTVLYEYVKNISDDFDKVREQYPDAEYLDWLRGKGRWMISEQPRYERTYISGVMYFGKYAGRMLKDIPVDYIKWLYNTCESYDCARGEVVWWDESRPIMEQILTGAGYEIIEMYNKSLAVKSEEIKDGPSVEKLLEDRKPFIVHIPCNLSESGMVISDGMFLSFPESKEYEYRGFPFRLPLKNGKAKRIKNKRIEVLDYELTEYGPCTYYGETWRRTYEITVHDFNVIK